jgi:hypothetical protein
MFFSLAGGVFKLRLKDLTVLAFLPEDARHIAEMSRSDGRPGGSLGRALL